MRERNGEDAREILIFQRAPKLIVLLIIHKFKVADAGMVGLLMASLEIKFDGSPHKKDKHDLLNYDDK